ncbi:hypothetical protein AVEN_251157-1 [Araneus ventricosus]|uniref:Uncharacterized protein n=1 Tax=Araneus ventricosus TaxID=182803 RepID=A0A4Y2I7I9_ARAVE|nr:hypothetical protein AVEN_251157-1 [Araneus ventricosus]
MTTRATPSSPTGCLSVAGGGGHWAVLVKYIGRFSPGRATQGVKARPICPAKVSRHRSQVRLLPFGCSLKRSCTTTLNHEIYTLTALSRFVSGHLRSCSFSHGNKVFPVCPKCGVASASPEHILSCLRLSRETFETDSLLALDFLRVSGLMDGV